ncbi:uncharacterized protein [Cicer arietinum]|uniref:tyrosine--tRNA ligase n=1 Tax=Cicer arietinum TaxID=3827 RepID=A0A3Q7Y6S3_CICAR|nr:uncharacterized protein LOC113784411 isoform X2 [Cicer arietinum]
MCLPEIIVILLRGRKNPLFYPTFSDMVPGLQQGQEKMSKSDPLSSIFMEDEEPVREQFRKDSNAKELLKRVKLSFVWN